MAAGAEHSHQGGAPAVHVPGWASVAGLVHGFFGRAGGVSAGEHGSLNLSDRVGDDLAAVAENWRRVRHSLRGLPVVRMRQVHGAQVVQVTASDQQVGEADGLLTARAGLGLAVMTADCVPILGVAASARAVLAVHAGWKGTLAGIARVAVEEAQRDLGIDPSAWQIALGPAIDGCCYETDASIGRAMIERWGAMPDAWQPAGAHGQLDLRTVNRHILTASGVAADRIVAVGPCTSCRSATYFSHRRSAGRAGRQASIIGWLA